MSPHHRGPTGASVMFVALVVVVLVWLLSATATTPSRSSPPTSPPPCAQHWPPTCKEASHGRP
jgi:hypothetical protein